MSFGKTVQKVTDAFFCQTWNIFGHKHCTWHAIKGIANDTERNGAEAKRIASSLRFMASSGTSTYKENEQNSSRYSFAT